MINLTKAAADQIKSLNKDNKLFLRIFVVTGGCSGMSYKMEFEDDVSLRDRALESNGIKILIDSKSLLYVVNMTIDFEGGLNGQGFIYNNPNAIRKCGCGTSFGV